MMKTILASLLLAVCISSECRAQEPQYDLNIGGLWCQPCWSFGMGGGAFPPSRFQTIFLPSDFPTAPSGVMKNIYLRVGRPAMHGQPTTYYDFMVKMGYSPRDRFLGYPYTDTFIKDLPVVFSTSTFVMHGADTLLKWIKIPLNAGNFYYDRTRNFVVELLQGPSFPVNGIDLNAESASTLRNLRGPRDSATTTGTAFMASILDMGFDIAPTGVDDVRNITAFGLFPNPVVNGRFNISFDAALPVNEVRVNIIDATGHQTLVRQYHRVGNSFFKEIAMSDAAKGVYFVEVLADGDRLVRRVIIQ